LNARDGDSMTWARKRKEEERACALCNGGKAGEGDDADACPIALVADERAPLEVIVVVVERVRQFRAGCLPRVLIVCERWFWLSKGKGERIVNTNEESTLDGG